MQDLNSLQVLDGPFEFYGNRLLEPADFVRKDDLDFSVIAIEDADLMLSGMSVPDDIVSLPHTWNDVEINGQPMGPYATATYRIHVRLPPEMDAVGLKMLDSSSAYRLYVNGRVYAENGRVGTSRSESVPDYRTRIVNIQNPGEDLEIILQVANFHHRLGGAWELMRIGPVKDVTREKILQTMFQAFIAGSLMIMGIYHLAIFYLRRKDRSTLWFGLFCILLSFRGMTTGERILHDLLPFGLYFWEAAVSLEYLTMVLSTPLFYMFMYTLYPEDGSKKLGKILLWISVVFFIFVVLTPTRLFSHSLFYFQFVMFAVVLGSIVLMSKAVWNKRPGAVFVTLTTLFFAFAVINDLLYNQQLINTMHLSPLGLFVFIFAQSFNLSTKFAIAFRTIESMTENLQRYNKAYSRFVPTEFLRFLDRDTVLEIELGDQVEAEMTILFIDIRNFSSISEGMNPQENFNFLNKFLGRVGPLIRKHSGFIDKYLGDGFMALFPGRTEDAVNSAIEICKEMERFNAQIQEQGQSVHIRIGCGIHRGRLMLGTVGEEMRMDGTVISDAVNLAARLEGLTKKYGSMILLSEDALFGMADADHYKFRFLGKVLVKGRSMPVSIFEILDTEPEKIRALKMLTREDLELGIMLMHEKKFKEALGHFERALFLFPDDTAAKFYQKRLQSGQKLAAL